jgi:hypothetical protein
MYAIGSRCHESLPGFSLSNGCHTMCCVGMSVDLTFAGRTESSDEEIRVYQTSKSETSSAHVLVDRIATSSGLSDADYNHQSVVIT